VRQQIVFMHRDGVRINDQWVDIRGRRLPLSDFHELFVVHERANVGVAALAAAATAACTLGAMAIFTAVPVRLGTASAILAALVVMIAVQCSRPRRVSLWVSLLGREQILLESARATFVNQVVRALVRASAYKGAGRLVVYRVSGRRPRPGFVAVGVLTAAAGLGALVLTLCNLSGVQLLGLPY